MTRWDELISLLKDAGVTERQVALAVAHLLGKARSKDMVAVGRLEEAVIRWRSEDRAAE